VQWIDTGANTESSFWRHPFYRVLPGPVKRELPRVHEDFLIYRPVALAPWPRTDLGRGAVRAQVQSSRMNKGLVRRREG